MGKRQERLKTWIASEDSSELFMPRRAEYLVHKLDSEIMAVYRSLGGRLNAYPDNYGSYDISYQGIALELDEEQHFNRYRLATLCSPLYLRLPTYPRELYSSLCSTHELYCWKSGRGRSGYWTNGEAEIQFGASPPNDLLGDETGSSMGPARWRQRAFYDFLKDIAALAGGPSVVRLSIWEPIEFAGQQKNVRQALTSRSSRLEPEYARSVLHTLKKIMAEQA